MSRDPLEELFGQLEPEDADDVATTASDAVTAANDTVTAANDAVVLPPVVLPPAPVPPPFPVAPVSNATPVANAAPAFAPAPARPAAQVSQPYVEPPTMPVPAGGKRSGPVLPWIIVGAVAVLALVGALVFISTVNGPGDAKPEANTEAPPAETEVPATDPTEDIPEETPTPEPTETKPPKVDVGRTVSMPISYAGITVEASAKLEPNGWYFSGSDTNRVTWESNLMNSFPNSCSAMRSPAMQSPWGIEQDAAGKWVVVRPAGTCEADPDLYNEVWGLMQAVADSAKPLEG